MAQAAVLKAVCNLAAGLALGRLIFGRRRVKGAATFDMDPRLLEGKHWVSAQVAAARLRRRCGPSALPSALGRTPFLLVRCAIGRSVECWWSTMPATHAGSCWCRA